MDGPDVRWDGISHGQIVEWMSPTNAGAAEVLETRFRHLAATLAQTADMVNTALRRIDGGEWSGDAATVTAQAMRHLRDFDDRMSHHSDMTSLAVAGQLGNAMWAKSSVPPVVDLRGSGMPTGNPMDVFDNTQDFQRAQDEAKTAEERARQVMSEYQDMTTDRIAALPQLAPAPPVVIDSGPDILTVPPRHLGGADAGLPQPHGEGSTEDGLAENGADTGSSPSDRPARNAPPPALPGTDLSVAAPPVGRSTSPSLTTTPTGGTSTTEVSPFTTMPGGSLIDRVGDATKDDRRRASHFRGPGRGQPRDIASPRVDDPEVPGAQPGAGTRTVVTGTTGRPGGTNGGPSGTAPFGAAGTPRSDEHKDHQRKYGVPGSELFEPDHHNGLLCDPYRPGAFVAPASIGDEDDE